MILPNVAQNLQPNILIRPLERRVSTVTAIAVGGIGILAVLAATAYMSSHFMGVLIGTIPAILLVITAIYVPAKLSKLKKMRQAVIARLENDAKISHASSGFVTTTKLLENGYMFFEATDLVLYDAVTQTVIRVPYAEITHFAVKVRKYSVKVVVYHGDTVFAFGLAGLIGDIDARLTTVEGSQNAVTGEFLGVGNFATTTKLQNSADSLQATTVESLQKSIAQFNIPNIVNF
jgi:hypothetical protein